MNTINPTLEQLKLHHQLGEMLTNRVKEVFEKIWAATPDLRYDLQENYDWPDEGGGDLPTIIQWWYWPSTDAIAMVIRVVYDHDPRHFHFPARLLFEAVPSPKESSL